MIIGITGNSGTGKTSICKEIIKNSTNKTVSILDADKIAKELAAPGEVYFKQIVNMFGKEILNEDGTLNRIKLANIIFKDSKKREKLDEITYKYVGEETVRRIEITKSDIVIIDAPLLIESNLNKLCDVVISVIADKKIKLERICKREKSANARLEAQKDDEFYIKNSNYVVINNNLELEEVSKDILEFLNCKSYNDEIVIIQTKDFKIMEFKKLLEFKKTRHCYTLRPLDFGTNLTYKEKENEVLNNYKLVCSYLKLDSKNIVRAYQTHTKNVKCIDKETGIFPKELIDVDGLITNKKDKVLSQVFADCTPLLLFDNNKNVIANIHSGWQGTLNKIVEEAINKMIDYYKCNPKDIMCFIGPTIRKCHFEVEEDVKIIL